MKEPQYEERFGALEEHAGRTERQLGELAGQVRHLADVQTSQSATLDRIVHAVTRYEVTPKFNFAESVRVVRDLFAIGAILGGLSIWLVLTLTAAGDQVTDVKLQYIIQTQQALGERLQAVSDRANWAPRVEGGAR